ncbi:MAG TPA: hypothetical protein VGK92_03035 [Gaiellales bacterium]
MYHVAIDALLAVAFFGPVFAFCRSGTRGALLVALLPASAVTLAAVVSLGTAWGQRRPYGDLEFPHAVGLFLSAVVVLVGGVLGLALARAWGRVERRRQRRREERV